MGAMNIHITRREVLNNLIRLKDHLLEISEKDRSQKRRTYKALFNQHTGDLRFAKKISSLESHLSSKKSSKESLADWKEIYLLVEEEGMQVRFAVCDAHNREIMPQNLSPLAWRILSEMLTVLNQKGKELEEAPPEILPEEKALQDLSSIRLASPGSCIEDLPGWKGALNREKAEAVLAHKPIGSYLLREGDEITLSISFHLGEEEKTLVRPYLLTFVDEEEKISEILLLQTAKGWTFYHDDPDLRQPFYHYCSSVQELLRFLHQFAKTPIS